MEKAVCLIIPPSGFLLDERVFMPLGILRVAAALEMGGVRVEMLDLSGIMNYVEALADHAKASTAECFGITATSSQLPAAMIMAQTLRETRPKARLILGGPHVTLVNSALKKGGERPERDMTEIAKAFDVLVAGDGEKAVFEALKPGASKLIDADDLGSPFFLSSETIGSLPMPARHLVDVGSYRYEIEGTSALSLIAQLGCPFSCRFCGGRASPSFRRVRMRSSDNVVMEMVHLHETYGTKGFMFYDDELNVNRGLVPLMRQIASKQRELGVEWKLRGFVKAELFTDEQAATMREAGFRWVLTGFESGSSRILENIDKNATREDNTRCLAIARKHGLKVKALMSIGHPGESPETIEETKDWLLTARPDDFDLCIITTYPGTPYYDEAVRCKDGWVYTCPKSGDRLYQEDISYAQVANYYKGRPGNYRVYVHTDHLSSSEIGAERDAIEHLVRLKLGIPFPRDASTRLYEHSMGQHGNMPPIILRKSP